MNASLDFFCFFWFFAATAQAQVSRRPLVAVPEVYIRPPSNPSKALSQAATDIVMQQATRKLYYDVTPRAEVEKAIKELHFVFPLTQSETQAIGKKLGTDRVMKVEITEIGVTQNPHRAHVNVTLAVTDTITGELVNGSIATGYSPPTALGSDEELILQAVKNAIINSSKGIINVSLPTATILEVKKGKEVRLNRGERDGIHVGDTMIVVRGNKRVGRIKVSSVGPTDSRSAIMDGGKEIRPEDQAIGMMALEDDQ